MTTKIAFSDKGRDYRTLTQEKFDIRGRLEVAA